MQNVKFDCDCDRVIEMEDMQIGVPEILQYAQACLPKDAIGVLIQELEKIASTNGDGEA